MPAPIWFRGRPLTAVKHFVGGTHRTVAPEETLDRIRPHFKAVGLTRLADITGLDRIGIPTTIGHRPNSPTMSNSAGKGFTLAAALASGAMEAIEVYHAESVRLPARHASYHEVAALGLAIPLARLTLTKVSLFHPDRPEIWAPVWDLAGQREVLAPWDAVSMVAHPRRRPWIWHPFSMSSNGLASGNHLLEAMCAALLEVVERDALACHVAARRAHRGPSPRVDLDSIESALVADLLRQFESAGVGVVLYDLTADTAVPVFQVQIHDRLNRHFGVYSGYGAHLDPAVAMTRALTEAAQSRLTYIAGSRDDYFRHDLLRHRLADDTANIQVMERQPATVDARARRSEATGTFEGDVAVICDKLRRRGLDQVLVADLTHEEIGIPVVRVIVPGLESYPHHNQYAPGARALAFAEAAGQETGSPVA